MPRIYKSVGPTSNKAVNPVKETKTSEGKPPEVPKSSDKKNGEQ